MASSRDTHKSYNTLLALLNALHGYRATVELRNESSVHGRIDHVGTDMSIFMTHAVFRTLQGVETRFDTFYLKGKNIRFVHIPDEIDMAEAIRRQVGFRRQDAPFARRVKKVRLSKREQRQLIKEKILRKVEETKRLISAAETS